VTEAAPIIELSGLSVRYGSRTALDGLDLSLEGGAVGLLGPNGAGKSSLIKTLLGLVPMAAGNASVLGEDVRQIGAHLRRRIGYMPERDAIFPGLTGFQATRYAGLLSGMPDVDARRRAHEVLLFAGMEEARYRDVGGYSTGMRQRIKLAQALVHDPDLLFLDEPTNGLDPKGRAEMLELIRQLSQEKGIHVILSTHLLHDVEEVCSAVVVLQGGRLVRHEKLDALARSSTDACFVRLAGEPSAFVAALAGKGLEVSEQKDRDLHVRLSGADETGPVFAAAVESGAIIRELRPVRVSLEEAIIEDLGGEAGGVYGSDP
jgi:ABC-2 type transport system ATP-binding protein